jgi:hypothetical protein
VWTSRGRTARVAAVIALALSGCANAVSNPISPQQARAQVVDAARDIVATLRAEVTEATFRYESCNDQGDAPFRGVAKVSFWMPGVPHNQSVDPQAVIGPLVRDGWSTNSDFTSHAPTLRKDKVNVILTVLPAHFPAGVERKSHAWVDVNGECRDTFDHRTDDSILPVDIKNEVQ